MMSAWYTPTSLSPYPSSRPELDDPEDEDGMLHSRKYIEGLIDDLVAKGVPPSRIVLGGFSQGHAISLVTGLTSPGHAGRLAGLIGLSEYLPLHDRILAMRTDSGLPEMVGDIPMFIVRGKSDMLVPKRYLRLQLEKLKELGVPDSAIEVHEYNCLGHNTIPEELMDFVHMAGEDYTSTRTK
jgi:predicted esterase